MTGSRDWTLPESAADMDNAAYEPEWEIEQASPTVAELDSPFACLSDVDSGGELADLSFADTAGLWETPLPDDEDSIDFEVEAGYADPVPQDEELPEWETFLADEPEAGYPAEAYLTEFEVPTLTRLARRIVGVAVAERDRWANGAKRETDQAMIPILRDYWKTGAGKTVSDQPQWHSKHPWSAVFISWVMRRAGATTFPPQATAHRQYISAIKRRTERGDTSSEFWAYPIDRVTPDVGDLICADRKTSGRCNGATYDNIDNGTKWATHCDVVIAVDRANRIVTVVGGNVDQSVKAKRFRLDAQGFLLPKQGCGHFAVIKVRDVAAGSTTTALSGDLLAKATRLNRSYGQSLGWRDRADAIAGLVGAPGAHTDETRFAQAVAVWQRRQGFTADGIVGPTTWAQLRRLLDAALSQPPSPQTGIPPFGGPKQPPGFKPAGKGRGLAKYSDERLDTVLRRLRQRGRIAVTDETMDTFQRIANVETNGRIQGLNTWDSAVVSSGFLQLTIQHGKLQEWIRQAPSAFRRFGIAIDEHLTYQFPKQDKPQPAIAGVPNRDELRWNGWAERFYLSGLDEEVIATECVLAELWLKRHLTGLRARLRAKKQEPAADYFQQHYDRSAYLRGMFQAAYNNLPAVAATATINAVRAARTSTDTTTERFVSIYADAIIAAYAASNDNGTRIVTQTRSGLTP